MTRPPASGTVRRTSLSRLSAPASTAGIHSPVGFSAVRQAWEVTSLVTAASPSEAAISSPPLVRQRICPEYAMNMTGRTTWSRSALP